LSDDLEDGRLDPLSGGPARLPAGEESGELVELLALPRVVGVVVALGALDLNT
jgi:hypothetical protein